MDEAGNACGLGRGNHGLCPRYIAGDKARFIGCVDDAGNVDHGICALGELN